MDYRPLGQTGVQVSALCLGAMNFGSWGNPDPADCVTIIHRALDAGINFIDTADVYSNGESELIVGQALAGRRDDVILATKFHHAMGEGVNRRGNSRRWIMLAVEDSLRRLGTDWIDLYQVHRDDPSTDLDTTLGALSDLVTAGKIRYIGISTFPAHRIVRAQWVAEARRFARVAAEQPPYSLLTRAIEADVLPVCREHGMGVIPWGPLNGGWLTGRFRKHREAPDVYRARRAPERYDLSRPGNALKLDAADALGALADEAGLSLIHVALAFVANHPAVTAPTIGPRTAEQLDSQLGANEVRLTDDMLDRIDAIVPPGTNVVARESAFVNRELARARRRRPTGAHEATAQ